MLFTDRPRCHEPFVGVRRRHADVHDRDVGLVHRDMAKEVVGVARLGHDLEARLLEQAATPSRRRTESSAMTTLIALPSIATVLRNAGKSRGSPSASS